MAKTLNERPIPPPALRDPDAIEMLRVWIAEGQLQTSIKIGMYAESTDIPEDVAWGKILADLARHISNALQSGYGFKGDVLERIQTTFVRELGHQPGKFTASFHQMTVLREKGAE